ncbi:MAG: autotransporter-associated beta strand repeat-containing protein, partial [Deltaproteobacteria bacterium]|nr:autotransporter-associated beta strand repeat-containing protein [Deltaproteobacteria bacterium]
MPVSAADFEVTDTGDSGAGTLRQAVLDANASEDAENTIVFDVPDSSTISLLTSLADISTTLTIDGTTAVDLTISGNGADQIFRVAQTATSVVDVGLTNGPLEMATGTALSFDLSSDAVFTEIIRDSGALEKRGTAKLTLSGANTYSGGTLISEGTLQGDTTSLQGDIVNNGSLVFDETFFGLYTDEISGTGTVTLRGGFLSLTGDNTYSGGTTLGATATLLTEIASLPGDVSLTAGSQLVFADVVDGTYAGDVSGTGTVFVQVNGTIRFTGTHTYSGVLDFLGGTLIGDTDSFPVDILNAGALVFDQGFDATFAPLISGAGSFEKRGGGTLTFSGAQTYMGLTTVSAGQLDIAGIGGAAQVDAGAALGGDGTIGGDLTVDGTVSPG